MFYYLILSYFAIVTREEVMAEFEPRYEGLPELGFVEGWDDILSSPDAVDYQHFLEAIIALTQQHVLAEWVRDQEAVAYRWKVLVEQIAYLAILEDDLHTMTPSEIVETALITLMTNLESVGWVEEGKSVLIPDLALGEGDEVEVLDITDL